jgi:hypothetical protein
MQENQINPRVEIYTEGLAWRSYLYQTTIFGVFVSWSKRLYILYRDLRPHFNFK